MGLARPLKPRRKVTWPQARAFSVHLLTASGSFLAFLSLVAASEERWTAMFWWLGLALFVDGIDGPIARKLEVKEILPTWSGELLDNIIDYVTYVLIPAFALYQFGLMGEGLSFLSAAIIVVSSAIYYADTGMKTKENFFKGFPVVWNMVVFTLFVIEPGQWVSFAVVVIAGDPDLRAGAFPASGTGEAAQADQPRRHARLVRLRGAGAGRILPRRSSTRRSAYWRRTSVPSPRSASASPASTCSASAASCSCSPISARSPSLRSPDHVQGHQSPRPWRSRSAVL